MRIAFATYGRLDQVSGGFVYDRALVAGLAGLGHEIEIVSLPWLGYARAVAENLAPWPPRWAAPGGVERARRVAPDVVVEDELIHPSVFLRGEWMRGSSWGGRAAGVGGRAARVALVHNLRSRQPSEALGWAKRQVERRYLASVDGVLAVCASTLEDVRSLGGGAPARVVYAGRDHIDAQADAGVNAPLVDADIERRSREPGPLRVLHVAAVAPHKGLARWLAALGERRTGFDFRLDVVGSLEVDRAYARALRATVASHPALGGRVQFHGEQGRSVLCDFYRRAHVLVLPSDREAYSMAALEAMGFGVPVLATNRGGMRELITDGEVGDLLDPDDARAWIDRLAAMAEDRAGLARRGRAALRRHAAHATWSEVARTVQGFLEETIARRRSPSHA